MFEFPQDDVTPGTFLVSSELRGPAPLNTALARTMPQPSFTAAERALLDRVSQPDTSPLVFEASYLVPAAVLVGIGFAYNAPPAFAAAFAIIVAFRYWQLSSDRRFLPIWREIIRKYERACEDSRTTDQAV